VLRKNSFETVVPSLLGPEKVSDPDNAEIEYAFAFDQKYPTDGPSVFGLFTGSLVTAKRPGPMRRQVSSGQNS
jgi:hypothetical protein